ncbi:Multiple epidermal growth factor-like domains protein 8 [Mortierella claussenii]|nr:Multiple epidermal growth factor-like domains protein 8 [Mortierella claussenii]
MAYDPVKDMVYITGGTSFDNTYLPMDLLAYTFATNKWNKIVVNTKRPDPRYGHFSFIYNNELYIYGGMTVIGGMADVWKFNGKQWAQQPANSDHLPAGRIGAACVVITFNNVTQLVVFGGMNVAGETMRDLNIYNVDTATWKKADHKNSVGLAGATAVYHKATESVYFFGGMVNQTTRNTIPYQYFIQHDLWYALAPRIDPLTATPVTPFNGQTSSPSSDYDTDYESASPSSSDGEEGSEDGPSSMVQQYLPPVMYDPVSGVWSPAGMMGDDIVVMYGGMRPFGLGLNVKEQACYVHKMSLFDLSCQSWSSYNMTDANGVVRDRVNHTMVLRPPGAAGGSMTAWTVYIFGGFDGYEHQDMVNITLNIPARASSDINACRALRWCSLYDDCQNCNPNYCSYVNGLCLFDTDKAKTSVSATGSTSSPLFLVGAAADVPKNGTLQDLIRQRPELKTQVLTTPDNCPTRMALDLGVTHTGTIQPGEEIIFKTYIDAQDLDIRFEITTNVTGATLDFKSLNVWEGFMNMYWRADHGLTDDSWNGWSGTSSPVPADIPMSDNRNRTAGDGVVITLNGVLNVSELLNRWDKYSGLDASPSSSALFRSTNSLVDFPAGDPRRFSGYHVYSLKNTGSDASFSGALSFSLTVKLLDHPVDDEKGEKPFDLATLGFVMAGFILGVMLLILIGRKVRQLMQKREEARRTAAELRMLEEEAAAEEEEERRRRLESAAMAPGSPDPGLKDMKPLYRIILSVQPQFETTLRYRGTGKMDPMESTAAGGGAAAATKKSMTMKPKIGISNSTSHSSGLNPTLASATTAADGDDRRNSRAPLDFILDLGSSPPNSTASKRSRQSTGQGEIITSHLHQQQQQQQQKGEASSNSSSSHVQRRWSLKNLSPSASLNRLRDPFKANRPGDQEEGLVGIGCGQDTDNDAIMEEEEEEEEEARVGAGVGFGIDHTIDQDDDDQRIIELGVRSSPEQHDDEGQSRRRQNPLRVQAISIEPLVFHGALVPRTRRYYRRYQRLLARRHRHGSHGQGGAAAGTAATPVIGRSMSRRSTASERQQPPSQRSGALNKIQRTASRMTQRSRAASISSVMGQADRSHEQQQQQQQQQQHRSETIEMESLGRPTHFPQYDFSDAPTLASRKTGRMRGRQEYEPGPLVGVNVLIVFPGDAKTRPVMRVGEAEATVADSDRTIRGEGLCRVGSDGEGAEMEQVLMPQDEEQAQQQQRLPPMAIGTVFLPDPVRWWVYKARQEQDRVQFEKEMARLRRQQELFPEKSRVM